MRSPGSSIDAAALIGRDLECARVDALLDAARGEQSGALVVRGEVGIGKTALLLYSLDRAGGMTILRARGMQSETELAFAALGDFFRPVIDLLDRVPDPQAAALRGALALGPPVAGDRFTVCAATLSLLAAAAEDGPVLGVVDDTQWLDNSSSEALLFAARRLESEGVFLLLGFREGEKGAFAESGLDELSLQGLDRADALQLLSRGGRPAAPGIADRLVDETRGNPLALLEIPVSLSDAQLAGEEPLSEPLPPAPALERAFQHQIEALPDESRQALYVAAASRPGRIEDIVASLGSLGISPHALDAANEAGLISVTADRLDFRHPLLRAAAYHAAPLSALRAAHRALAEGEERVDRRAWHLAAAAPALDDEVATALEEAAFEARARGGHPEAALALERAARLTTDDEERARRLGAAADDARIAGQSDRSLELLDEALVATSEPSSRARIQHLRGAVEMWFGSPSRAYELLVEEANAVAEADQPRAARMLTDAAFASFMAADIAIGVETAERASRLAEGEGETERVLAAGVLGVALLLNGRGPEAIPLLQRFEPQLENPELTPSRQLVTPAQVLTWLEEYDLGRRFFDRLIGTARANSAPAFLPFPLAGLSELDFRTGNWPAAYAGAAEAVRIAEETGQRATQALGLVSLARVEAGQGRTEEARAHAVRALEIAPLPTGAIASYAVATLAFLELGVGNAAGAISLLGDFGPRMRERGLGEPAVIQWAPDLIEAYVRVGRIDDAARELESLAGQAEATGRNWAIAAVARCRGIIADDDEFEEHFTHAIELHARTPTPFERARTELSFGERLRRSRRRSDAREPLRSALEALERLGASPWAERTRIELGASGETARRRDPSASNQLTPQELQVALAVAQGATNREAGAALFLSPKTIEAHLGRIYRKLAIRSRTELAHLLATEGTVPETAS